MSKTNKDFTLADAASELARGEVDAGIMDYWRRAGEGSWSWVATSADLVWAEEVTGLPVEADDLQKLVREELRLLEQEKARRHYDPRKVIMHVSSQEGRGAR